MEVVKTFDYKGFFLLWRVLNLETSLEGYLE